MLLRYGQVTRVMRFDSDLFSFTGRCKKHNDR